MNDSVSPGYEPTTQFLNVDLEIWSRRNLDPLVERFPGVNLHHRRTPRGWHATFEVDPRTSLESTLRAIVGALRLLPDDVRALWDACYRRDFNIGVQAGANPGQFELSITPATLADIAGLGGRIVFTVYGARPGGRSA